MQRHMRTLENGACTNRKIQLTEIAAIIAAFSRGDSVGAGAGWALNSLTPNASFKVYPG